MAVNSCTILFSDNLIMSAVIGFITLSVPRGLSEVEMKLVRSRRSHDEIELTSPLVILEYTTRTAKI